ncbi:MAG: PAS domain-containing sensor histidine kinase [Bacteroidia bacterium 44-10]|nr:MAG: PAS domain-containing sensor histidine kinase [Bacteroidia bacterium 44-10]
MKLKVYFYILAILLLLVFGFTLYENLDSPSWKTLALEGLILGTLVYLVIFYRKTVRPLQTISNGMDLLREQDFSSKLREVGQYEADRVVAIFNRMMAQLKNERLQLREQNEFLDLLITASPMGVIVLNYDHQITDLNPAAVKLLDVKRADEVKGKTISEIKESVPIDLSEIPMHETRSIGLSNGTVYKCSLESFVDRGFPRPFYLIESLTEEVRRAEKKAYEKVIRMISHEVNNTTAGITSTLDTVIEGLEPLPEAEDMRQAMQICVERCYGMSRFITNFADVVKIPKAERELVDLNRLIANLTRFMEVMCTHRNIRLTFKPDENLQPVLLDTSLFDQVILNIIKNAVESIEENGEIIITTEVQPKKLVIADNGKGISKEVEKKIFNPFFSSKPQGQGIGLLFIREVLAQHDVQYSLCTYPDNWTRFIIRFD